MGDSKYSLLVTQSLLEQGRFDITQYSVATAAKAHNFTNAISIRKGIPYQLERHRKRLYYYFPPGTSILSLPFVALSIPLDSAPAKERVYSEKKERALQAVIGSALMALVAGLIYLTARLYLSRGQSVLLALGGGAGTMMWSTASRGLPSHSWGIFLLMAIVYILLKERSQGKVGAYPQWALATLVAWTFFIRPTFAIPIAGISIYYLYVRRSIPVGYSVTGLFWLMVFLGYSYAHYGQLLPNYYLPGRIHLVVDGTFWERLTGVLISPSRGVLIFVPTVLACGYLLVRYRRFLPHKDLVLLSVSVVALHAILIASFRQWWGGYCYGPRLFTDILPWFFLIWILSLKARESALAQLSPAITRPARENIVFSLLLIASLLLHGIGAWSESAWKWNEQPMGIDENPERLWDWRHPQFLGRS